MRSINVNIVGTANMSNVDAEMKRVNASVAALNANVAAANAQLGTMVNTATGPDPKGYRDLRRANREHARFMRDAAASTGMVEVQQVRLNKATDTYIKNLEKQKLSFKQMRRDSKVAYAALQEQLAMRGMLIRENYGSTTGGKVSLDTFTPNQVGRTWEASQMKLAMLSSELKSGATQMINWGKNTQWAGRQLMVGFTIPVAAAGAALGVLAYGVDKELTRIAKVYDTYADRTTGRAEDIMAAEKELAALRESGVATATKAAREYGVSGKETLDVQAELAAVGLQGQDLQKSTNEVMRIATLGEIDRTVATKAMIAMQSTLNASVEETAQLFNYMNSVENATSLATADFAEAIPRALGPMREMSAEGASAQEVFQNLSVLMVAMKERGIEAGEGANAVKALMSRLYRPSKQVSSEWQAMGLGDPRNFAKEGKDIMEILAMVNERVRNLRGNERTQALAGLFGTYQVARMNAMLRGLDSINDAGSQTARVFEVMNQSADQWAETADNEVAQKMSSLSGRWDAALESMKMQAQELGRPFLEVATVVVGGIGRVIEFINKLPGPLKVFMGLGIGLAAIAGPIIMLTGLFANLAGQAVKGAGTLIGMATKMEILNKESFIARKYAEMVENGFMSEATAAEHLASVMNMLSQSIAMANNEQKMLAMNMEGTNWSKTVGSHEANALLYAPSHKQHGPGTNKFIDRPTRIRLGEEAYGADLATALYPAYGPQGPSPEQVRAQKELEKSAKNTSESGKAMATFSKAAAFSTAAMAGSLATSAIFSGEASDSFANILMISSMAIPAVQMLGTAAKGAWQSVAGVQFRGKMASGFKAITGGSILGGLNGIKNAFLGLMGPLGWITLAVTAIGTGIFAWAKHMKKAREEQEKLEAGVVNVTDKWAEAVGKTRKAYKGINNELKTTQELTKQNELRELYSKGEFKGVRKSMSSSDVSDEQKMLGLESHFAKLQVEYGIGRQEAEEHIRVLLELSNFGLSEQNRIIEQIGRNVGTVGDSDMAEYLEKELALLNTFEIDTKGYEAQVKQVGLAFGRALTQAGTPQEKQAVIDALTNTLAPAYESAFDLMSTMGVQGGYGKLIKMFKQMGIDSGQEFYSAMLAAGGKENFIEQLRQNMMRGKSPLDAVDIKGELSRLEGLMGGASQMENSVVSAIANAAGPIGDMVDDVETLPELLQSAGVMSQTISFGEAKVDAEELFDKVVNIGNSMAAGFLPGGTPEFMEAWKYAINDTQRVDAVMNALGDTAGATGEQLAALAKIAEMSGFKRGATSAETIANMLRGVRAEADSAATGIRGLNRALSSLSPEKLLEMYRGAASSAQQDVADGIRDSFDSQMNSAIESRQAYWDNRQRSLSAQMDRRQRGLDAKWENKKDAAEKYWDRREKAVESAIEAEQKAEELRKKMFDAEIARINKLAEMANTNIDFNVALNEGDFDAAAKIRNDQEAQNAEYALDAAATAGSAQSNAIIDRLEARKDKIGEERDAAMKAMDKREAAEKRHLENVSRMREDALKRNADADMAYQKKMWDSRKKNLDDQIKLFLAYAVKDGAELKKHLGNMGVKYDEFGGALKNKGDKWAKHFETRLQYHLQVAREEVKSSHIWEQVGRESSQKLVRGLGFRDLKDFWTFVRTGKKAGPETKDRNKKGGTNDTGDNGNVRPSNVPVNHSGGLVGSAKNSRVGVARTNPIHPSEQMILAQKDEYIVNKKSAAKNMGILDAINSGANLDSRNNRGPRDAVGGGNPVGGLVGAMTGLMTMAMAGGADMAFRRAHDAAQQRAASQSGGAYTGGKAGKYGDRSFGAEQLKNAAIIASVGSKMGMSARDIQIGIMTAITESGLVNVNYGDRDSLGLFQQRPSMGWGTPAQVTNPRYASKKFFGALKGHAERNDESPWLAAQHVQRSAFSDGSNYRQYWDEAQAIFKRGIVKSKDGGYSATGFVEGSNKGWSRASKPGKGWHGSHDYRNGAGSPLYAVHSGRIIESRAITSGGSPGNGLYSTPYRSYGETIVLNTPAGNLRYAHLAPGGRYVKTNQYVRSGALIGRSGNTGNAWGSGGGYHTHFDINGNYNARQWMEAHGIGLRKGTEYVNYDNTLANLHKGEAVLTRDISSKFREGVDNFAKGGQNTYNINVNVAGTDASADEIANKVVNKIKRQEARKPQSRRNS